MAVCLCRETADRGAHGFNRNAEVRKTQGHGPGLLATVFRSS